MELTDNALVGMGYEGVEGGQKLRRVRDLDNRRNEIEMLNLVVPGELRA